MEEVFVFTVLRVRDPQKPKQIKTLFMPGGREGERERERDSVVIYVFIHLLFEIKFKTKKSTKKRRD